MRGEPANGKALFVLTAACLVGPMIVSGCRLHKKHEMPRRAEPLPAPAAQEPRAEGRLFAKLPVAPKGLERIQVPLTQRYPGTFGSGIAYDHRDGSYWLVTDGWLGNTHWRLYLLRVRVDGGRAKVTMAPPWSVCGSWHERPSASFTLATNAGEIVLDRLLVEQLRPSRVTFAVRGAPVINDATIADAEASGMAALVEVVNSGSDAPGTILEDCSRSFRERFNGADLVLSKGQGNFETLGDVEAPISFLLKAKCAVVSEHLGCVPGDLVLVEGIGRRAAPPRAPGDEERVKRR